jgi:serine/threonine protein kinase
VPGDDLRTILMEARRKGVFLGETQVLGWGRQLADALSYLHSQEPPVVHRDIKPSNLKITPAGVLKLVDFGLVKIMAPDQEMTITVIQGLGTALYTPLEQYGSDETHTDTRSDIYSYGATLYHLLTNESPVDARKRFIQPASLVPPRQINPNVAPRTEKAILWAMALHPDDRPQSMDVLTGFLFEGGNIPTRPRAPQTGMEAPEPDFFASRANSVVAWAAASLLLLSLIATLIR